MLSDMDRTVNQFGGKSKIIRRRSSCEWEIPSGEAGKFARIKNTPEEFKAKIDLGFFSEYKPEDIDVQIYGYDLQIHADQQEPTIANLPRRRLSRQYRLPDDTDLETIKLKRNLNNVDVEAKKPTHRMRWFLSFTSIGRPKRIVVDELTTHDHILKRPGIECIHSCNTIELRKVPKEISY
uniref:SHSP domain-containing protein n=1 Tax=Ascaris lumbricoides TaxID=6252 RepID=A0A0M3HS74_ASCLU